MYLSNKKSKNLRKTRYSNSVVFYKSLSCRASLYEDEVITDYCVKNNLSKSLFLTAAAMYCASNNINANEIIDYTSSGSTFNYRDYIYDEYDE